MAPPGFPPSTLTGIEDLWSPLRAGELLARVGHFLKIMSQMEELGYIAETMARAHRQEAHEEWDEQALMQGRKKLKRGEGRRRNRERMEDHS